MRSCLIARTPLICSLVTLFVSKMRSDEWSFIIELLGSGITYDSLELQQQLQRFLLHW